MATMPLADDGAEGVVVVVERGAVLVVEPPVKPERWLVVAVLRVVVAGRCAEREVARSAAREGACEARVSACAGRWACADSDLANTTFRCGRAATEVSAVAAGLAGLAAFACAAAAGWAKVAVPVAEALEAPAVAAIPPAAAIAAVACIERVMLVDSFPAARWRPRDRLKNDT